MRGLLEILFGKIEVRVGNGIFYIGGSDVLPPPLKEKMSRKHWRQWSRGVKQPSNC